MARRVHDGSRQQRASFAGSQRDPTGRDLTPGDDGPQRERRPTRLGISQQRKHQRVAVDDPGRRGEQCGAAGEFRLQRTRARGRQWLEVSDSIGKRLHAEPLEVRFLDRFFDNDVMTAMSKPVFAALKQDDARKEEAMVEARRALDLAYGWLEQRLEGRTWAAGERLSMADCAAAPSLFYADWVHPIADAYPTLRAYRSRLLAWPAFARAVDEARPFRHYFPLGAPDRD
jgi:hypothetical protein